jgi:D-3-phosphoglycerate dehydrogenase
VDVLLVRSATKVRQGPDRCLPRAEADRSRWCGLDNIDVAYAKEQGHPVINTPASSSISVAELVMAHLFT